MEAHNVQLEGVMSIDGTVAAAHVDWVSGECLWSCGDGVVDVSKTIDSSVNIVRIKASREETATNGNLEDVLITLPSQYHILHRCGRDMNCFVYLVVDRTTGNLALARRKLASICGES